MLHVSPPKRAVWQDDWGGSSVNREECTSNMDIAAIGWAKIARAHETGHSTLMCCAELTPTKATAERLSAGWARAPDATQMHRTRDPHSLGPKFLAHVWIL